MINAVFPLRECELFRGLEEDELARVAIICSEVELTEGVSLFSEEQPAKQIYVVTQGKIALHKALGTFVGQPSRRFATVAFCSPGQIVGWSALVEPYQYTLSATAWESCQLLGINSGLLRRAMDLNPGIGYRVMKCLSEVMGRRLQQVTQSLTIARENTRPELKHF